MFPPSPQLSASIEEFPGTPSQRRSHAPMVPRFRLIQNQAQAHNQSLLTTAPYVEVSPLSVLQVRRPFRGPIRCSSTQRCAWLGGDPTYLETRSMKPTTMRYHILKPILLPLLAAWAANPAAHAQLVTGLTAVDV